MARWNMCDECKATLTDGSCPRCTDGLGPARGISVGVLVSLVLWSVMALVVVWFCIL